jgi:hypothetical protein
MHHGHGWRSTHFAKQHVDVLDVQIRVPSKRLLAMLRHEFFELVDAVAIVRCAAGVSVIAYLLHCRSPFYLCLEHVDNLGAYSIPSVLVS